MMIKKSKILLSTLAVLVLVGAGCATNNQTDKIDETKNSQPIKIGLITPLSGDVASLGENIRAGAMVAEKEINAEGGIGGRKLEIIYEDGKCDTGGAVNAGNKLINVDQVKVIVGGACSGETLGVAPLAEQNQVVLLSPASTNQDITNAGDYIFRLIASDAFQGKFVADYIYDTLGKRQVAIIYNPDKQWSAGVKQVFETRFQERGGQIVTSEGFISGGNDARVVLTKIKSANPEIIYAPTLVDSGIAVLKQSKELGITAPILGGDVWDDAKIAKEVGTAGNGARFTVVANKIYPDAFVNAMAQLPGGKDINAYAPRAYDAVKILSDIMRRVGEDSNDIKNELYKLKDYRGIADDYTLDSNGDMMNARYTIKEFRDGTIVEVK